MALLRFVWAFAFIVCSVKTFAASIEDEILDADALSRRGGWPKQREERQLIHDNRENAMLDDFEKKMAELSPAERFDWHALLHSVSKHVAKHVAENLKARVLAEEGERLPEGYDELTPEERSWYGSLASALLGR
ncbi:hypothetical protein BSL78_04020 [Apostichopus japonicus]|uniref:Uncharacterized protein n=1 Tax=Stichopus japonicus TaxID=307972 RepID=A0A2G8LFN7_STIJA|nr:hypothetical protein BSL78_04020 [Apostichopus japonicus]